MENVFAIRMHPNHKEHHVILIGITDKPEEFIIKWLNRRPQFKLLNSSSNGFEVFNEFDKLTPEKEEYYSYVKHDKTRPLGYENISWGKIRECEVWIPLEGDARYMI